MNVEAAFQKRVSRTHKFLKEKKPGTVLWTPQSIIEGNFELHWISRLMKQDVCELLDAKLISEWNDVYLKNLRSQYEKLYAMDYDAVPTPEVYFGIGAVTAAMSGEPVQFMSDTSWCEPNYSDWDFLEKFSFDPDNVWIRFHTMVLQDMINKWEGDYCLLPYLHRSPLDAANGLRGNDLFMDLYDDPDCASKLIMKCADWSIACERHLKEATNWPKELPRGAWVIALPDDCVFVNGDPVDLVNTQHQAEFDRPSTGKLFTQTGGGFFHHHALGLRQAENVAQTKGLVVQDILNDPGITPVITQMIQNEEIAQKIIHASLKAPVRIWCDFANNIEEMIPILEQGCFILVDDSFGKHDICSQKLERFRVS